MFQFLLLRVLCDLLFQMPTWTNLGDLDDWTRSDRGPARGAIRVFLGDGFDQPALAPTGQAIRHRLRLRRYRAHADRPADAVVDLPDLPGAGPALRRAAAVQRSVRGLQGARRRRGRRDRAVPGNGRTGRGSGRRGEAAAAQGQAAGGGPARPQDAGAGAARVSGEAQRRQDPDRQHRKRAGDREPARDLLGRDSTRC